jgi:hypothetical protein
MGKPHKKRDGTWKEPKALRRLRANLTDDLKLHKFRTAFDREPSCEEELDLFIEELTREMYNSGCEEWPIELSDDDIEAMDPLE